ncbi:MAG: hypothetical protein PHO62_02815 [Sulfurimonas sp.]|uniref:hypothetical protein n=1 Tax=Sulfurimonas sp. TaxID=2022749 RepID=UPI00262E4917|nr:hypothetical protein [Sulfurimonas sp.]MDD5372340.1 hypothetical protein [Sulfurimonas sp.]
MQSANVVIYNTGEIELKIPLNENDIWLSANDIASIFGVNRPAIVKHIGNIYKTDELSKNTTCSILEQLAAMGLNYFVIHDRDIETPRAKNYNRHILTAMNNQEDKRIMMECIEDKLGYLASSSEKPYNAYQKTQE